MVQNIERVAKILFFSRQVTGSFIVPIILSRDLFPGDVFITKLLKYNENNKLIKVIPRNQYDKDILVTFTKITPYGKYALEEKNNTWFFYDRLCWILLKHRFIIKNH